MNKMNKKIILEHINNLIKDAENTIDNIENNDYDELWDFYDVDNWTSDIKTLKQIKQYIREKL